MLTKRVVFYLKRCMDMRPSLAVAHFRSTRNITLVLLAVLALFVILELSWTKHEKWSWAKHEIMSRKKQPLRTSTSHVVEMSELSSPGHCKTQKNWTCIDRLAFKYNRVEDIFCTVLPTFLSHLKNPCFNDFVFDNKTRLRCLPYFFIIGMDKCGSTDLHNRIVQHPFVLGNKGSLGKETSYWSWTRYGVFNKKSGQIKVSLDEYINMFAETGRMIQVTNIREIITGDATPMDLWDFRSWTMIPQNYGKQEPEVLTPHFLRYIYGERTPKFLIQFREPIERLYSDYIFLEYGTNPLEFHNHSLLAIEMMNKCLGSYSKRICYFSNKLYQDLPARIHLGCYSVFLQEWFNVFPRSSFLITTTDEYENNMTSTLSRVFTFLELPSLPEHKMAEILNQTRRHVTKNKNGVILPETVEALRKFYDSCNKETAELLQDDRFLWLDHYS